MLVSDIIETKSGDLVTTGGDASLPVVLGLMVGAKVGSVIVLDEDQRMLGIVTERSVVEEMAINSHAVFSKTAQSLMRTPVPTCAMGDTVQHAMHVMTHRRMRHLVVLDGGYASGIVSIGDLIKSRLRDAELENLVLRDIAAARLLNSHA